MATSFPLTIDAGQSEQIELDTSSAAILNIAVDPGDDRGIGSGDPPIREYELTVEKNTSTGFEEVNGSPLFENELDESNFVAGDITGTARITISNQGTSKGTVTITVERATGDRAVQLLAKHNSVRPFQGSLDRIFTRPEGGAITEKGDFFRSIQTALDNADRMVVFGPGVYEESTAIDNPGITLAGYGSGCEIDASGIGGGGANAVGINEDDCNILNFSTRGGTEAVEAVGVDSLHATNIRVLESGSGEEGFQMRGGVTDPSLKNVIVEASGDHGIRNEGDGNGGVYIGCKALGGVPNRGFLMQAPRAVLVGCYAIDTGNDGYEVGAFHSIVVGCYARNCDEDGFTLSGSPHATGYCQALDNGDNGIDLRGTDNILASCVTAANSNTGILTSGATTPQLDHNLDLG